MIYYFDTVSKIWNEVSDNSYVPSANEIVKTKKDFIDHKKEEVLKEKILQKKQECRDTILSRYSETDQLNLSQDSLGILGALLIEQRPPTQEEGLRLSKAKEAKKFQDEVLTEFRTNGLDADFSKFK